MAGAPGTWLDIGITLFGKTADGAGKRKPVPPGALNPCGMASAVKEATR